MALTKLTTVLNKISSLADAVRGQATAVKAAFDHDPNVIKDYINDTLIPGIEAEYATHEDLQTLVIGEFGEDFVTENMMAPEMKKDVVGGIVGYDAFDTHLDDDTAHGLGAHISDNTAHGIGTHILNHTTAHTPETPILPTLINGWSNGGSGYAVAKYWKDTMEIVHIQGLVTGSTLSTIFTLPVGYRPAFNQQFTVMSNGALGRVVVGGDGNVAAATGSAANFDLSGITFRAGV